MFERSIKYNISKIKSFVALLNTSFKHKKMSIDLIKQTYSAVFEDLAGFFKKASASLLVDLAEQSILFEETEEESENLLDAYFQGEREKNSFYIRALLVKATLETKKVSSLKAEKGETATKEALEYLYLALETLQKPENKQRYSYLVYNMSLTCYKILKSQFREGWCKDYADILEKISALLEESDDTDNNWRMRFLTKLAQCYLDGDKKTEAGKAIEKIGDILKKKGRSDFDEELLRLRIHLGKDNSGVLGNLKKEAESQPLESGLKATYQLQCMKSGVIPAASLEKEIQALLSWVFPSYNTVIKDQNQNAKMDAWKADTLAELSLLCCTKGLYNYSDPMYDLLTRSRSCSLKGKVYLENTRAHLRISRLEDKLKEVHLSEEETADRRLKERIEGVRLLERNLAGCVRLFNQDLVNDTSRFIFNFSIPLLKTKLKKYIMKYFASAADQLEVIESNENLLRVTLHFELAKFNLEEDLLNEAKNHLEKALSLDYSTVLSKLAKQPEENDNVAYFQRYFEQHLVYMSKYIAVKTDIYGEQTEILDILVFQAENLKNATSLKIQESILDTCIAQVKAFTLPEYSSPADDLVEEEEDLLKHSHSLANRDREKHFVRICAEIAKYAFKYRLLTYIASIVEKTETLQFEFDKEVEEIVCQSEIHLIQAKVFEEYCLDAGIDPCTAEITVIPDFDRNIPKVEAEVFTEWKKNLIHHAREATTKAVAAQQHWQVFNIAISIWNMYLPILKVDNWVTLVDQTVLPLWQELFEALSGAVSAMDKKVLDTDSQDKNEVYVQLSAALARLLTFMNQKEECIRVCDTLLSKNLHSNKRKIFDGIKTRAGDSGKKAPAKKEKGVQGVTITPEQLLISECFAKLEGSLISEDEKAKGDSIKEGFEQLKKFKPVVTDIEGLEIFAELWYKYGVQFSKQEEGRKTAIFCGLNCTQYFIKEEVPKLPKTLLKWYGAGFLLLGESLLSMFDKNKQDRGSQVKLVKQCVVYFREANLLAMRINEVNIAENSVKGFFNAITELSQSQLGEEELGGPFTEFHASIMQNNGDLKQDYDFILLFYSYYCQNLIGRGCYSEGEEVVQQVIKILPENYIQFMLEHKLIFFCEQGKDFIGYLNVLDDRDSSVKGKLFLKLALSSKNKKETNEAFKKGIDILKKDSNIMVVDLVSEYAAFLYKNGAILEEVEDMLLFANDTLLEVDPAFDEKDGEDDNKTLYSRRTNESRRSRASKRSYSKMSESKKSKQGKRSVKTDKSKQRAYSKQSVKTKSVFSDLINNEAYPLFLNCNHYSRLFANTVLMAQVSRIRSKKVNYLIEAVYYLQKIIDLSFTIMNAQEFYKANKEKLEQFGEQSGFDTLVTQVLTAGDVEIGEKHKPPTKFEEWLDFEIDPLFFELSKSFNSENYFSAKGFGRSVEFTNYLMEMLKMGMDEYFLHPQMLFAIRFGELFGKVVVGKEEFTQLLQLKKERLLRNIGRESCIETDKIQLDRGRIMVEREELKKIDTELQALDGFMKENPEYYQEKYKEESVRRVNEVSIARLWCDIGEELVLKGCFEEAKVYLTEASFHAKVRKDKEMFVKTAMLLNKVDMLESRFETVFQNINNIQEVNTDCSVLLIMAKDLNFLFSNLSKYEDYILFASQMKDFIVEEQDSMEQVDLLQFLNISLALAKLRQTEHEEKQIEIDRLIKGAEADARSFVEQTSERGCAPCRAADVIKFVSYVSNEYIKREQFAVAGKEELDQLVPILETSARALVSIKGILVDTQALLPVSAADTSIVLPVHRLIAVVSMKYCQINNSIGLIKNRLKAEAEVESHRELEKNPTLYNQEIIDWLNNVTIEIAKIENEGKIAEANRYEKSLSILGANENLLACPVEKLEFKIEYLHSIFLQSVHLKELTTVWDDKAAQDLQDQIENSDEENKFVLKLPPFHQSALNKMTEIENQQTDGIIPSIDHLVKLSEIGLEISGKFAKDIAIRHLFNLQNHISSKFLAEVMKKYSDGKSSDWQLMSSRETINSELSFGADSVHKTRLQTEIEDKYTNHTLIKNISEFNTFASEEEWKEGLDSEDALFIFQMNEEQTKLFVGFVVCRDKPVVILDKFELSREDFQKIKDIKESIGKMKYSLMKTVFVTDEEIETQQKEYQSTVSYALKFIKSSFFETFKKIEEVMKTEEEGKKTKGTLPCGIERLIVLADYRLMDVPLERLDSFNGIPIRSNDLSLSCYKRRLSKMSPKEKGSKGDKSASVYLDTYSEGSETEDAAKKLGSQTTFYSSAGEKPSSGTILTSLNTTTRFLFLSQTSLLFQLPPSMLLQSGKSSLNELAIVLDRVTCTKDKVDQKSLVPTEFSLLTQPEDMIGLLTLAGASTLLTTRWSLDVYSAQSLARRASETVSQGKSLSELTFDKIKEEEEEESADPVVDYSRIVIGVAKI